MTLTLPDADYSDDLYTFRWPTLRVEALVERLAEDRTDIRCELTVRSMDPQYGGRLFSGRLLLMGPNSRRDIVRSLVERNQEIDWAGVLEQLCLMSKERYRSGEPIVNLMTVPRQEKARFLYEPFILDNGITILYGDGATAKSNLALDWALYVSLHFGSALYLDWEDDAATHNERLLALCAGLGVEDPGYGILYQRRHARLADTAREVRRAVAEHDCKLVIIDSLGMAAGDPNDSNLVIEAMRACRALGVAVLCIHHLPKNALDKSKPFGTVYASNEARLTWLVEKAQEEDEDEFTVLLTNHKSNRSRTFAKRALRVKFVNNDAHELISLAITPEDAAKVDSFRPKLALWKHISHVLNGGALTVAEIRKALATDGRDTSEANVRRAINEAHGAFVNVGTVQAARWGLAEHTVRTERTVFQEPAPWAR